MSAVDSAVKNAPAGTENAVSLVKSAIAAANNAYESVNKAAKQAADMAEANFTAITNTAVKASQRHQGQVALPDCRRLRITSEFPHRQAVTDTLPRPARPERLSPRYPRKRLSFLGTFKPGLPGRAFFFTAWALRPRGSAFVSAAMRAPPGGSMASAASSRPA